MRATLASLILLVPSLFGIISTAASADKITYLECRADNEDKPSLFALDDTTQKVCDRAVQDTWFSPTPRGRLGGRRLDQGDLSQGEGKALRAQCADPRPHRALQSRQGAADRAVQAVTRDRLSSAICRIRPRAR